jgi:hypothetical protein
MGKNSTVQSESSSSCQCGSMSCCRFIVSVSSNLDFPEIVAETHDTSGYHSAGPGAHLGCTALRIALRSCSRYWDFPTT